MTGEELPGQVIALTPSKGSGGGIEGYARGLFEAMRGLQVDVCELPLASPETPPGPAQKAGYLARVVGAATRRRKESVEVFCLHPGLLPAALLARSVLHRSGPVTTVFHGIDIWSARPFARRLRQLRCVRPITVSSFSAGAMTDAGPTLILPPAVDASLFASLVAIDRPPANSSATSVLSVFRFGDYAYKGGPELVAALARLRAEGHALTLTIAGRDAPSDLLDADLDRHGEWMRVIRSPTASQLVQCYTDADLFVLATRQQRRPYPAGEGFGIVLAEAALAGLPVVAPANDGSRDAFISGLTGLRPRDQSVGALTEAVRRVVENPIEAHAMGRNGRVWAEQTFDPARYRSLVASTLWGTGTAQDWFNLRLVAP